MKKLILTSVLFLAGIFIVSAQDKIVAKATNLVNQLNQICGLTPDQAAQLQPLAENYLKERKANKLQYANDPGGRKSADKIANENYKNQLKNILTPEQMAKIKEYHAQHKADGNSGEAGRQDDQSQPQQGGGQQ